MFSTNAGPVLGMAELLSPCSVARMGLQPFRFITLDDADLRNLRIAIASSQKSTRGFRADLAESPGVA